MDFSSSKIPEVALHLASRLNLPTPTIPPDSLNIPFVDNPCSESHTHILPCIFNIGEIIIHNDCTLDVLRKYLLISVFIAIAHHEPTLHMSYAEALDMLSIGTDKFVFHIFPEQSPRLFLATFNLIRIFQSNHTIYAWSPAGLIKLLSDRHAWSPNIHDIKPEMLHLIFPNGNKTARTTAVIVKTTVVIVKTTIVIVQTTVVIVQTTVVIVQTTAAIVQTTAAIV